MQAQLVRNPQQLEALGDEWRRLWKSLPDSTPFQSPHWCIPWWRHFGEGELLTVVIRDSSRALIGLAPFYAYDDRERGARRLFLLGMGNTDYLDVLFAPGRAAECWRLSLDALRERRGSWDSCELRQLREGSAALGALPPGWREERLASEPCPSLLLGRLEQDERQLAIMQRADQYSRRLEREGRLELTLATDRAGVAALIDSLIELHRARWSERNLPGVLASSREREFHHEAAQGLLEADALRLRGLSLGGRTVAVLYGFRSETRTYFYLSGFDPRFARFSPGTVLLAHAIREARAEGCLEFDFLRGREPYKYRWGAQDRLTLGRGLACPAGGASDGIA